MAAIRAERDYVVHEDFMKVRFFTHLFYLYLNKLVVRCWLTSLSTNFISGCAQAKWCKEAGIECALQRRLWEGVVTPDFATKAYAVYHWGAQPSPCESKKEIGYLCSGSWTFLFFWYSQSYWGLSSWPLGETIREFTNFEPVAVCFSSLVTLVRAVSFPSFHVLGQCACLLGNRVRKKRLVCVHLWIAMFPRLPHAEFNLYGVHEFCVFRKKKLQLMQALLQQ